MMMNNMRSDIESHFNDVLQPHHSDALKRYEKYESKQITEEETQNKDLRQRVLNSKQKKIPHHKTKDYHTDTFMMPQQYQGSGYYLPNKAQQQHINHLFREFHNGGSDISKQHQHQQQAPAHLQQQQPPHLLPGLGRTNGVVPSNQQQIPGQHLPPNIHLQQPQLEHRGAVQGHHPFGHHQQHHPHHQQPQQHQQLNGMKGMEGKSQLPAQPAQPGMPPSLPHHLNVLPNRPLKRSPPSPKDSAPKKRPEDKDDDLGDILPFIMENVNDIDPNLFDDPDLESKLEKNEIFECKQEKDVDVISNLVSTVQDTSSENRDPQPQPPTGTAVPNTVAPVTADTHVTPFTSTNQIAGNPVITNQMTRSTSHPPQPIAPKDNSLPTADSFAASAPPGAPVSSAPQAGYTLATSANQIPFHSHMTTTSANQMPPFGNNFYRAQPNETINNIQQQQPKPANNSPHMMQPLPPHVMLPGQPNSPQNGGVKMPQSNPTTSILTRAQVPNVTVTTNYRGPGHPPHDVEKSAVSNSKLILNQKLLNKGNMLSNKRQKEEYEMMKKQIFKQNEMMDYSNMQFQQAQGMQHPAPPPYPPEVYQQQGNAQMSRNFYMMQQQHQQREMAIQQQMFYQQQERIRAQQQQMSMMSSGNESWNSPGQHIMPRPSPANQSKPATKSKKKIKTEATATKSEPVAYSQLPESHPSHVMVAGHPQYIMAAGNGNHVNHPQGLPPGYNPGVVTTSTAPNNTHPHPGHFQYHHPQMMHAHHPGMVMSSYPVIQQHQVNPFQRHPHPPTPHPGSLPLPQQSPHILPQHQRNPTHQMVPTTGLQAAAAPPAPSLNTLNTSSESNDLDAIDKLDFLFDDELFDR